MAINDDGFCSVGQPKGGAACPSLDRLGTLTASNGQDDQKRVEVNALHHITGRLSSVRDAGNLARDILSGTATQDGGMAGRNARAPVRTNAERKPFRYSEKPFRHAEQN